VSDVSRSPEIERAKGLARAGRLYPSVIVHGGSENDRRSVAAELARTLLCEKEDPAARPCRACRHCRRIEAPPKEAGETAGAAEHFHPDFAWLERDLKTSTSAESTRDLLISAQLSPYEARGQVFVIADAASLSGEAADALLKAIEEPGLGAPRNYFLLAPSRFDLPPTLRSRSLAIFLGAGERPDAGRVANAAAALRANVARAESAPAEAAALFRLGAAAELVEEGADFSDPRVAGPWLFAASVASAAARVGGEPELPPETRRRLLALAEALLTASPLRLRGIQAERIFEGLVAEHLGGRGGGV
jgi:hypothetical protein